MNFKQPKLHRAN